MNRTGHGKTAGIVVDYYGVARHLKEALAAYSAEDIEGALQSLKDEIPKLRDRHQRAVDLFLSRGIEDLADIEHASSSWRTSACAPSSPSSSSSSWTRSTWCCRAPRASPT